MKRIIVVAVVSLCMLLCACAMVACDKTHSIECAFSAEGLDNNPDRGFRGELYLTLGRYGTWPGDAVVSSPTQALDDEIAAYPEQINVIQQYVYLIDFWDKDLTAEALNQLTTYFEYVKSKNVKLLLRFAYEYDAAVGKGPTTAQILRHISSLKGWLNDGHMQLFKDVIYSVQLGMIGLWGEGHTSVNAHSVVDIMRAMADFIPKPYQIMLRYYTFYAQIPDGLEDRFGVHEDWIDGLDSHLYDFFRIGGDEERENVFDAVKDKINDVEMPWGRDTSVEEVEPIDFIKDVLSYSATTLSVKHNYIEDGANNAYNLARYKKVYLDEQQLKDNAFPYRAELLTNGKISVFDYLKYHLGYLLSVDEVSVKGGEVALTISNFGFAAASYYYLQVLDKDGNVLKTYDLQSLLSGGQVTLNVNATEKIGVRIVHKVNSSCTAKLANDFAYENGVNVINL